jgi:predicted transcriptional regulator
MSNPSRKSKELTLEEIEALPNPLDMTDEEFWAGARESVRHYEETGLHLTHDEVKEWMRQRALGNRIPMPKLHT